MAGKYEIGAHSSDITHPHVAYRLDGDDLEHREELFDVSLYHIEEDENDGAYIESKEALERMVARANGLAESITRIQNMRDKAAAYVKEYDRPGEWLDEDGSWTDWDSECEAREAQAIVDTFDRALDVLQTLAHGGTPAQGENPTTEGAS